MNELQIKMADGSVITAPRGCYVVEVWCKGEWLRDMVYQPNELDKAIQYKNNFPAPYVRIKTYK